MSQRLLTLARDLRRRKARERQGLFVAEGVRAVEELLDAPVTLRGALAGPALAQTDRGRALRERLAGRGIPFLEVSDADFASTAETESPQGVLAMAAVPAHDLAALALPDRACVLVLDGVQDPGNVGTILRTAAAFGVAATLALPGTVDLWNAKVVRSAMGALFRHPAMSCTWEELDAFRRRHALPLWGTDAGGEPLEEAWGGAIPPRLLVAVSNEGSGATAPLRARVDRSVALRLAPGSESLNVAVAAGIVLHDVTRRISRAEPATS